MATQRLEYSWGFMRELIGWARWIAAAAAIGGSIITRDWRFLLAVVVAATIDIWTLSEITKRGEQAVEEAGGTGNVGLGDVVHYMGIRFGSKAVLLLAAVTFPQFFDFWGMVIGVLIVDATVFTVGSVIAAVRLVNASSH